VSAPVTLTRVLRTEVDRCRMRPVLGRAPLLGVVAVATTCAFVRAAEVAVERPQQVGDTISIGATVAVLVAVGIGAGVVHDARASGMDATDRSMVGRRCWLPACRIAGVAAWVAIVALVVSFASALGLTAVALLDGHVDGPGAWLRPAAAAGVQAAAGASLGAAAGAAAGTLVRSPTSVVAALLALLLVGDPLLAERLPATSPLLLADNLLGLASGNLEGLAVRASSYPAVAGAGVVGTGVLVVVAIAVDARRDVGG